MPSSKPAFLFSATQSVDNQLGDIFSFIWASYAGLRELWWQVRGFKNEFPTIHIKEVEKKFLSGLPLPGGVDLQKICIDQDWNKHENEFAKWLLFETCTLYEGWAEKVCKDLFSATIWESHAKKLQFPSGVRPNGSPDGYPLVIQAANTTTSPLMVAEFFPTLKASKLNCWNTINEHLVVYRYFKECRNAYIHSEGVVSQEIINMYGNVSALQTITPLPFNHLFNLPPQSLGSKIQLDIRDCILFATLVRKLICTFDAALCVTNTSEAILEARLKNLIKQSPKWNSLPVNPLKKAQRIHRMLSASRIPEPTNLANVITWMHGRGLI